MKLALTLAILLLSATAHALPTVRIKDIARIEGVRDNNLVGYGVVVGLAGTGDSPRSQAGVQSVISALAKFGVAIDQSRFGSRNIAAVMVTGNLPAYVNSGDRLDVTVSSIGDARSLAGGILFQTPLQGPDGRVYALAQGALSVGGFRYDAFGNLAQKNHPTVAMVPSGATVEATPTTTVVSKAGSIYILLARPDFTTAQRVSTAIAEELGAGGSDRVSTDGPDRIVVRLTETERARYVEVLQRLENVAVMPDQPNVVVVNERTGTVVAGGDVRIGSVTIAQGDLKVAISADYQVYQPNLLVRPGTGIRSVVVPQAEIRASEADGRPVNLPEGASIADLALALHRIKATPRDIIVILQGIERAGALNARLIIQ